jgi:hypothetical protein
MNYILNDNYVYNDNMMSIGGIWILGGQINLYRRVNELYTEKFEGIFIYI